MDSRICVYPAGETDFSSNGLGCISPTKCLVHWEQNSEYTLEIEHPIDDWGKYLRICAYDRTVVAPVPESPSMELRQVEGTRSVEIYRITGGRVWLRNGPGTSHKKLRVLRRNTRMTVLSKPNSSWYEVTAPDGQHGYMSAKYLQKLSDSTVSAVVTEIRRDVMMRPQPFDIYAWDPGENMVTARARHVVYRLAENIVCGPLKIENKTAQQALDAVFAAAENQDHGFRWHCEDTEALSMESEIEGKNLLDIIIGDGGICDTYGLKLLADWFDVFLVKDIGMDRGVQIRYGKNLEKMSGGFDISNTATRIIPVGQTKDGKPLYLGEGANRYLVSERENLYARPRIAYLKVNDAKVGGEVDGKKLTKAQALERMRAAAQAKLDEGCDLPECSINVTMAQLRRDPAYAEYATLETVCPGDVLGLFVPQYDLTLTIRVCAYDFDALRQVYDDTTLGTPQANTSKTGISSRQLGGRSITSSKLAYGAVGTSALADDVISLRHMQADSVNANALQAGSVTTDKLTAGSVTTDKLAAGSITSDKIKTGALDTITLDAVTAKIGSLTADDIQTDRLAAALAAFTVLTAGTASFDQATVAHLVAQAMNLEYGTAGQVFIRNLAVEYAQMVGAAIGNLCIRASDGNYYRIDVRPDGTVSAVKTTVSAGEIAAGQTEGGRVILETNITAANLNAGNLLATYALVNRIDAARLDVDTLFARDAFIKALTTSKIFGGDSLEIVVNKSQSAVHVFRQEEFPDGTVWVSPGDMLIKPSTGQVYQAVQTGTLSLLIDNELNVYYEYDGVGRLVMDGLNLYADGFYVSMTEDGRLGTPYNWELVQDSVLAGMANAAQGAADAAQGTADAASNYANEALDIANAALSRADFQRVVRIDDTGLHVGDNLTDYEVLLDSASVNVVAAGVRVSTFSDKFIRLDNMQIRKVRGGMAISVYKG